MSAVTVSDGYMGTVLRSQLPYHRGQKRSEGGTVYSTTVYQYPYRYGCFQVGSLLGSERNNRSLDGSVCALTNKLCPNDGTPTPVGCENKLAPALVRLNGGSVPVADPTPVPGVMTDARNGVAASRPTPKPVACGSSPTPIEEPPPNSVNPLTPVLAAWELSGSPEKPKLPPTPPTGLHTCTSD